MSKIALVLFPIRFEGGLATRAWDNVHLLRDRGHQADFYRIVYADKKHGTVLSPSPTIVTTKRGNECAQRCIAITDRCLSLSISILNQYDTITFVHPSPHLSDTQPATKNWWRLFTDTRPPKGIHFSDLYWDQYYPGVKKVIGLAAAYATNNAVARWVAPLFDGKEPPLTYRAYRDLEPGPEPREIRYDVVWANAWRGWKGVEVFMKAIAMEHDLSAIVFGSGREESNLKAEIEILKRNSRISLAMQSPPSAVNEAYRHARVSVDLTGASSKYYGNYNQTCLEPMFFGVGPVLRPSMVRPLSIIPPECAHVVEPSSPSALLERLKEATEPNRAKTVGARAKEWITSSLSRDIVERQLVDPWGSIEPSRLFQRGLMGLR
jgi:glycosyltransferase involved in cell wall biosynthesis